MPDAVYRSRDQARENWELFESIHHAWSRIGSMLKARWTETDLESVRKMVTLLREQDYVDSMGRVAQLHKLAHSYVPIQEWRMRGSDPLAIKLGFLADFAEGLLINEDRNFLQCEEYRVIALIFEELSQRSIAWYEQLETLFSS
jgi:hypothetical protein